MRLTIIFSALACLLALPAITSCDGGNNINPNDTIAPVISTIYPNPNAIFHNGDTLLIQADVSDETALGLMQVQLTNLDYTDLFYDYTPTVDGLEEYALSTTWIVNGISQDVNALVTFQVTDGGNHETIESIPVKLRP